MTQATKPTYPHREAVHRAIEIAGGQENLAKACGGKIRQQHISNWLRRDKKMTLENAIRVARATNNQVPVRDLCPNEDLSILMGGRRGQVAA